MSSSVESCDVSYPEYNGWLGHQHHTTGRECKTMLYIFFLTHRPCGTHAFILCTFLTTFQYSCLFSPLLWDTDDGSVGITDSPYISFSLYAFLLYKFHCSSHVNRITSYVYSSQPFIFYLHTFSNSNCNLTTVTSAISRALPTSASPSFWQLAWLNRFLFFFSVFWRPAGWLGWPQRQQYGHIGHDPPCRLLRRTHDTSRLPLELQLLAAPEVRHLWPTWGIAILRMLLGYKLRYTDSDIRRVCCNTQLRVDHVQRLGCAQLLMHSAPLICRIGAQCHPVHQSCTQVDHGISVLTLNGAQMWNCVLTRGTFHN